MDTIYVFFKDFIFFNLIAMKLFILSFKANSQFIWLTEGTEEHGKWM